MTSLPSYAALKREISVKKHSLSFIEQSRHIIQNIISGNDSRLLLIMGPCSIHDIGAAKEYALKLKKLSEEAESLFYIVMRVYCEKPRTASGWKGLLYDPHIDGSYDIHQGLRMTRQLMVDLLDMGIPTATEFLDPITAHYYDDLICWGSIGARTSSSQPHRQLASGLSMPVGIKNGVAGNLSAAIQGAYSASHSHAYIGLNESGVLSILRTTGNPDVHIVLRGGENGPNYDAGSIAIALNKLEKFHLPKRVVVDCSHGNTDKQYHKQPDVFQSIIGQILEGNTFIKGLMLESHLFAGKQTLNEDPSSLSYGISITDPCLDFLSSVELVRWAVGKMERKTALIMSG